MPFLILVLMFYVSPSIADKAGFYLGAGGSVATYRISTNVDTSFQSSRALGWRVEGGHIWDLGRPGGFHLGVAATFSQWGEVEESEQSDSGIKKSISAAVRAAAMTCVLEQEIVPWVDFVFKAGPTYAEFAIEENFYHPDDPGYDDSTTHEGLGLAYIVGFSFFPVHYLAIELAAEGSWFLLNHGIFDTAAVGALSASLQYRF